MKLRAGNFVVYEKAKTSTHPSPRAENVFPSRHGDTYSYVIKKFWKVLRVLKMTPSKSKPVAENGTPCHLVTRVCAKPDCGNGCFSKIGSFENDAVAERDFSFLLRKEETAADRVSGKLRIVLRGLRVRVFLAGPQCGKHDASDQDSDDKHHTENQTGLHFRPIAQQVGHHGRRREIDVPFPAQGFIKGGMFRRWLTIGLIHRS